MEPCRFGASLFPSGLEVTMQISRSGGSLPLPGPSAKEGEATTGGAQAAAEATGQAAGKTGEGAASQVASTAAGANQAGPTGAGAGGLAVDAFTRATSAAGGLFASALGGLPQRDIGEGLMVLMGQVASAAEADLREILEQTKTHREERQAHREAVGALRDGEVDRLLDGQQVTTTGGFRLQLAEGGGGTVSSPDGRVLLHAKPLAEGLGPLLVEDLRAGRRPPVLSGLELEVPGLEAKRLAELGQAGEVLKGAIDALVDKAKQQLDSSSEMGEVESLRLQRVMDRLAKAMSTLSNLLKKTSDTAVAITANLK
jgi:hypothetical protein